jgi:hypothetical protein
MNNILFDGRKMDSKEDKLYTLWLFNIAMENGPFKDGLPIY